jgi:FixJ family two-component response regulator/AraC-like DNA-binding protein
MLYAARPMPGIQRPSAGASARPPQFQANDVDSVREALQGAYGEVDFDIKGGIVWRADVAPAGPVVVTPNASQGRAVIRCTPASHFISLAQGRGERTSSRRSSSEIVRRRGGAVWSAGVPFEWSSAGSHEGVTLRIEPEFIHATLEALLGATVAAPLEFALTMALDTGPGASLSRLCHFLVEELERSEAPLDHPLIRAGFCEVIARALLLGQPHNHAHLLRAAAAPSGLRAVRMVEEYADAFAAEPIALADLTALTGESGRSIAAGFRAHRGRTLDATLADKRLALARKRLLEPGATVKDAALASGFLDLGAFEAAYGRRFQESPNAPRRSPPPVLVMSARPGTAESLAQGLREAGHGVVVCDSTASLLTAAQTAQASCAVVDAHEPSPPGVDVLAALTEAGCALPLVLVGEESDARDAVLSMKAGAVDFLFAPFDADALQAAVAPAIALGAEARLVNAEREALEARLATLSPREREVCVRVARGLLNKQIAADLGISESRVKLLRSNGMEKLGAESAAELGRLLERLGVDD